jgi:hypothetical protein
LPPSTFDEFASIRVEQWAAILSGEAQQAVAALGDRDAQVLLGQVLLDGRGVAAILASTLTVDLIHCTASKKAPSNLV